MGCAFSLTNAAAATESQSFRGTGKLAFRSEPVENAERDRVNQAVLTADGRLENRGAMLGAVTELFRIRAEARMGYVSQLCRRWAGVSVGIRCKQSACNESKGDL